MAARFACTADIEKRQLSLEQYGHECGGLPLTLMAGQTALWEHVEQPFYRMLESAPSGVTALSRKVKDMIDDRFDAAVAERFPERDVMQWTHVMYIDRARALGVRDIMRARGRVLPNAAEFDDTETFVKTLKSDTNAIRNQLILG